MVGSVVEEIKNRLSVTDVVGSYVKLQKAGVNYRALCPFHQEKNPSFFVSPARQMWHCFGGCGDGGDIFKFVMRIEGVEFGDALRLLAQKAGVELPKRDPHYQELQSQRKRLYEICEWATKFFEKQLAGSATGESAKAYLLERGLALETIAAWRLGYAPDSASALLEFLLSKGYYQDEVGQAGLLVWSGREAYDRFRGRIMFPVMDGNSQPIGFGGRIFGNKEGKELAKYVNTPNTLLYDKSKVLFGIDKAKLAIRANDVAILVEGYMDAIMVWQAGNENVVAVSGTALTPSHLQILRRYSENLLLSFDMDIAGDHATKRGIDLALQQGFSLKVITMPEKDPADVIKEGKEGWQHLLANAVSMLEFYFATTLARNDKETPEGKKAIGKELVPVLKNIPNKIEQAHWVSRLAHALQVPEGVIVEEMKKLKDDNEPSHAKGLQAQTSSVKSRKELLEERVLALIFRRPENLQLLKEEHLVYFSLPTQELLAGMEKNPGLDVAAFEGIFPAETIAFLQYLSLKSEIEEEETDWRAEFLVCLQALEGLARKEKLDHIASEIRKAEEQKDAGRLESLMRQFHMITRGLSHQQ